jgi:hypothetical protein
MQGSNYALITALYSNVNRGFYHDIYLPIISYAINSLHSQKRGSDEYFTAIQVKDFIISKFGIVIPSVVIARAVLLLQEKKYNKINLNVYEKGNQFQILAIGDDGLEDIDEKEAFFTKHLAEIESQFKSYVSDGGYCGGVTFVDFISANQDNILGYFENEDETVVDEKYTTIIFFLRHLRKHDFTLYKVASQLFWGSILAAFLSSSKPKVCATENNGTSVEYFLDTSIVLGVLCLSSQEKEEIAHNICSLVINSQGILRVHPITIEEVKQIISSVETQPAKPFSDIAEAIENHNLKVGDLAKIRLGIEKRLEQLHISIFPQLSHRDIQQEISKIKGKDVVKRLADTRWCSPDHRANDNFREIHDIFMDSYVRQREEKLSGNSEVYFVTSNLDLIRFSKEEHQQETNMLSAMDIILRLWMHNSKTIDIEDTILVEAIARCMDAHNLNVRNKIAQVAQVFNQNSEGYDEEVYKDFLRNLYVRARHSIECYNKIEQTGSSPLSFQLIKSAVDKDREHSDEKIRILNRSNTALKNSVVNKDEELKQKSEELKKASETIERQDQEIISLNEQVTQVEKENFQKKTQYVDATEQLRLYKERDLLKKQLEYKQSELAPLSAEKQKMEYKCQGGVFWFSILFLVLAILIFVLSFFIKNLNKYIAFIPGFISIGMFALNNYEKYNTWRIQRSFSSWPSNNKFQLLNSDIKKLTDQINSIEAQIKK